jgi:hypothetical protein
MSQTIPQILDDAKISLYLATNDVALGALYPRPVNKQAAEVIYTELKSVEWAYNQNPNYPNIEATANYLYWLTGQYNLRAIVIRENGGGGVPVSPTIPSITTPTPLEFIVSAITPIAIGGSSLIIAAYKGYNLVVSRNNVPQTTVNDGGTYYEWNKTTGLFRLFGSANEGELISITPVI